ncbi:alpha/beta hydrolase fold domain-containing protein [Nocardioides sp. L-11A]|uniref:alpha/beta hydrolase fold domain-containing protein n=1 Tax=Nocardioides sp. L-11A TaxID=3043848 RepID=UPI00249CC83D|nr:alpha/beta hydrolase fold domain-containing protein [Nocardioides sp. L-11A]
MISPVASVAAVDRWVAAQRVRPDPPAAAPPVFRAWRSPVGWSVFRYRPRLVPFGRLLWLPGGAFVRAITAAHWAMVEKLADETGFEAVVVCYPLLPRVRAAQAVDDLVGLIAAVNDAEAKRMVVMGDSAGAGLSLAATQEMARRGLRLPAALALVSPWVDLRLVDPGQPALEAGSAPLTIAGMRRCGELYAGELGLAHPAVSPLLGTMAGLPPLTLVGGTADLLFPDARRLAGAAAAADVPVRLLKAVDAPHNYPLTEHSDAAEAQAALVAACVH